MKLKRLEVNAFGIISPKSPVILDFTESNWYNVEGDQELGKTTLLRSLLVACGALSHTGKDGKDLINKDSDQIDINLDFVGKDKNNYQVRCTKTQFKLIYEGQAVSEPLTKMKELLGVVGVSPMQIKDKPLMKIVEWLATYSNQDVEVFKKKLSKFKDGIKAAADARAAANKSLKGLNEYLDNEPAYINWEESERLYNVKPDIDKLSNELEANRTAADLLTRAVEKVTSLEEKDVKISSDIASLKKQLLDKEEEKKTNNLAIEAGKKYCLDNKKILAKYEETKTKYNTIAQDVVIWEKWQEIKRKKIEKDQFETESQNFDIKHKQLIADRKVLQAEILPDIKGVELVTEDNWDSGELEKEGLYYNGDNVAQMSESQWFGLVMQIWRKYKVKVVVLDNAQDLGSKATEILQRLAKDGAYILTAEMNREQKELLITYE